METPFDDSSLPAGNYFLRHWRGELTLPISYWVNGVLIAGAVPALLVYVAAFAEQNGASIQASSSIIMAVLASTILLSIWSMIGIWRSADHHEELGGSSFWAHVAKFLMFVGAIRLVFQIVNLGPFTLETSQLAVGIDPLGKPAQVAVVGNSLTLTGPIALGTADRVHKALKEHSEVKQLMLTSIGGRLAEAAQISDLVASRQMSTIADKECSSACTMVLVSGQDRSVMPGTKVGFHSPSYPGIGPVEINATASLMADSYRAAGLSDNFVDQALSVDASTVWYPKESELFDAGVLNFMNPKRIELAHRYEEISYKGKLPRRVDKLTILEGVFVNGTAITYNYKVDIDPGQISASEAKLLLIKDVKKSLCAIDAVPDMIASGAIYNFVYRHRNGSILTQFAVSNC
jgi:hypothetical protein